MNCNFSLPSYSSPYLLHIPICIDKKMPAIVLLTYVWIDIINVFTRYNEKDILPVQYMCPEFLSNNHLTIVTRKNE